MDLQWQTTQWVGLLWRWITAWCGKGGGWTARAKSHTQPQWRQLGKLNSGKKEHHAKKMVSQCSGRTKKTRLCPVSRVQLTFLWEAFCALPLLGRRGPLGDGRPFHYPCQHGDMQRGTSSGPHLSHEYLQGFIQIQSSWSWVASKSDSGHVQNFFFTLSFSKQCFASLS